jgi:hypothetical protein
MEIPKIALLTTAVAVCLSAQSSAQSIGVNFGENNATSTLPSSTAAGLVQQTNFNNFTTGSLTNAALVSNNGQATTATLTLNGAGTYNAIRNPTPVPADGNEILNNGFVFGGSITLTVSNIPYPVFDLYIYQLLDPNASGSNRVTTTTVNGVSYYSTSPTAASAGYIDGDATTPYTYVPITSTDSASPTQGNYIRLQNLTGPNISFTATAPGNAGVNGFQIVAVPEPASAGLLALAALGFGARRRRRA